MIRLVVFFFFVSCTSFGFVRRFEKPPRLPFSPVLYDFAGVFHIHSLFSHDSRGTPEEIQYGAKVSGCDFLILTDHNNLRLKPYEGLHGGVLWIVGSEISAYQGHVIALGVPKMPKERKDVKKLAEEIRKMGGIPIIAHPAGDRKPWRGTTKGFEGVEIFNLGTEAKKAPKGKLIPLLFFCYSFCPKGVVAELLRRTEEELSFYDKIALKRPVTLLAGVDAHAIPMPLGGKLNLYGYLFPIVRIHVWAPRLRVSDLLEGIRKRRVYVSFDFLEDATSFLFYALHSSGKAAMMGDVVVWEKGWTLLARAPKEARFELYRNGVKVKTHWGKQFRYPLTQPGMYRLEVFLPFLGKWVPWIYSNPMWFVKGKRR